MKNLFFFLLGLLMITSAIAAEYQHVPLVREGVTWEYVQYNNSVGFNDNYVLLYYLEFNGTTLVKEEDGLAVEYYNLYRTDCDHSADSNEPFLIGYVKEQNKVVTAKIINFDEFPKEIYGGFYNWTPNIVYDFSKPLFMSIKDSCYVDFFNYYTVGEIEENVGSTIRKGYHLHGSPDLLSGEDIKIIEGIGIDCIYGDLLVPYRDFVTGSYVPEIKSTIDDIAELMGDIMTGLSAVYENGELVYKGCLYNEAQALKSYDAISTIDGDKQISSVHYYNLAGVESHEPQQGVNIRVTTYTDGSRHSEKIVR